jgi:hypothetical protein
VTGVSLAGGRCEDNPVLWDNDVVPNGFNGRAISPPVFPLIRVVDDFTITDSDGWDIKDFHPTCIEDGGWVPTLPLVVYIYADNPQTGCPGQLLNEITTDAVDRRDLGFQLFGRQVYAYSICFPSKKLLPGKYHIGHRWPNAGGAGTNYWLTSNGGEGTARTGCFSLDSGTTWVDQGAGWHHAFTITGDVNGGGKCCQEDIDKDCDVDFQDLLHLLAAWGPCPGQGECVGQVCGEFVPCEGDVCFCFRTRPGDPSSGRCVNDFPCANPQCPDGVCPAGMQCVYDTCCGAPTCAPTTCELSPAERELLGPTATGRNH